MAAVLGLGVALGLPAHEAPEIAVGTPPEHEMPVVGHQAPGEQPHAAALALLGEQFGEATVVGLVVEQRRPGVGAVEHVLDETADVGPGCAGHGRQHGGGRGRRKES